jgi:hypothetical protein
MLIVKKLDKEQSYLMVHFKEPDDFLHMVAVETLQWSINFPFFHEANKKEKTLSKL